MQTLPRWFRVVFVAVMLALCCAVAVHAFEHERLVQQIDQLTEEVSITHQRLRKQQMEYDQALADLPRMEAELAVVGPQAEAIYQQEQELRTLRKALRAEAKDLEAQLAALQADAAQSSADDADVQAAIRLLEEARDSLYLALGRQP